MERTQQKKRKPRINKTPPLTPEQRNAKNQRERMKDRAAILSIEQTGATTFRVWGGEAGHILTVLDSGLVICDCRGWDKARNHMCSHVYKHAITYGDLKRK